MYTFRGFDKIDMKNILKHSLMTCLTLVWVSDVFAGDLKWEEILGAAGSPKILWADQTPRQKAEYLELYLRSINYCQANIGENVENLEVSIVGPRVKMFHKITYETISMLYQEYGDFRKAAYYSREFWEAATADPDMPMLFAEENALGNVIIAYEEAGMYKEALDYYVKGHQDYIRTIKAYSDIGLFHANFEKYKELYPNLAENYSEFMEGWEKAKWLAKTTKPKPLDPAVQHHEWFYSGKRSEVLKALAYYHKHSVRFMLEKALGHKDPKVAAKAKKYLDSLGKGEEPGK